MPAPPCPLKGRQGSDSWGVDGGWIGWPRPSIALALSAWKLEPRRPPCLPQRLLSPSGLAPSTSITFIGFSLEPSLPCEAAAWGEREKEGEPRDFYHEHLHGEQAWRGEGGMCHREGSADRSVSSRVSSPVGESSACLWGVSVPSHGRSRDCRVEVSVGEADVIVTVQGFSHSNGVALSSEGETSAEAAAREFANMYAQNRSGG